MAEKVLHSRQPGGVEKSAGGASGRAATEPSARLDAFTFPDPCGIPGEGSSRDMKTNCLTNANNLPEGILIVDAHGLNCFANLRVTELTGYRTDELLKIKLFDLVHPDDRSVIKSFDAILTGDRGSARDDRVNFIHKNGTLLPLEIQRAGTTWFGKPACMILLRDMRAAGLREKSLRLQIDELRAALKRQTLLLETCTQKMRTAHVELERYKARLKEVTRELLETNGALSVLARTIDRKKDEVERKTNQLVTSQILPLVEILKQQKKLARFMPQIFLLEAYIRGLTSDSSEHHQTLSRLTEREMHIAALVRNGLSSQKIASLLHISYETVKTHRKNIRKKIRPADREFNLNVFLKSVLNG